jgi:LPS sulfotransferase NodH
MTKFMVVSTQRSGSTWVVDLLNSHPEVVCYGALFLPRHSMPPAGAADRPRFAAYLAERHPGARRRDAMRLAWNYLDELYGQEASGAVGFKFMYSQFSAHPWVLAYARRRGVRVIHLVRRNKLEHVLSKDSAIARGQFHALPGDALTTPPIHLDPGSLVKRMAREERKVRWAGATLAAIGMPRMDASYEDLAEDKGRFESLLRFLRVDPRVDLLRSDFQRWSRGTPEERIANYAEVKSTLTGTRFSKLIS